MAQQASSAQREPSMEEILASIRRIIEDNDTDKPEAVLESLESVIGPAANDPARSDVFGKPAIDGARAAEPREEPAFDTVATEAEEGGLDIEAFSAAIEEEARLETQTQWDVAALRSLDEKAAALARTPVSSAAPVHAATADAWAASTHTPSVPAAPAYTRAASSMSVETSTEPAVSPFQEPAEFRPSIISEHAGRQVAAAFGELSEAFAASRRRSFDEIAEEMIRPMLQDWLDNNLPVLVERLVREEIERVARGG